MDAEQLLRHLTDALDEWAEARANGKVDDGHLITIAALGGALNAFETHLLRGQVTQLADLIAHLPAADPARAVPLGHEAARQGLR